MTGRERPWDGRPAERLIQAALGLMYDRPIGLGQMPAFQGACGLLQSGAPGCYCARLARVS
jgi:hypothetical protein